MVGTSQLSSSMLGSHCRLLLVLKQGGLISYGFIGYRDGQIYFELGCPTGKQCRKLVTQCQKLVVKYLEKEENTLNWFLAFLAII